MILDPKKMEITPDLAVSSEDRLIMARGKRVLENAGVVLKGGTCSIPRYDGTMVYFFGVRLGQKRKAEEAFERNPLGATFTIFEQTE